MMEKTITYKNFVKVKNKLSKINQLSEARLEVHTEIKKTVAEINEILDINDD
jgi:hypothetical protein